VPRESSCRRGTAGVSSGRELARCIPPSSRTDALEKACDMARLAHLFREARGASLRFYAGFLIRLPSSGVPVADEALDSNSGIHLHRQIIRAWTEVAAAGSGGPIDLRQWVRLRPPASSASFVRSLARAQSRSHVTCFTRSLATRRGGSLFLYRCLPVQRS